MSAFPAPPHVRLAVPLVALLLATSSVVFVEPAPYDVLLVGILAVLLAFGMPVPREVGLAVVLLGAFVASNLLAAAFSPDPLGTLRSTGIRTYMAVAWLFFVCVIVADPGRILPALWGGYVVAAVGAVCVGVLEYYGYFHGAYWDTGGRAKGLFKDPNVFGPFLVPVALYCLNRLRVADLARALVYLALFVFLVFGILLSFSRGAWMNLAVSLACLLVLTLATRRPVREKLAMTLLGGLAVCAALAVVVYAVDFTSAGARFRERAVLFKKYDVMEGGRFYTQRLALEKMGTAPLGVGPGRTDEEFGLEPHNLYLHVPVEGGWAAGAAFWALLLLTFWRSLRLLTWRPPVRDEFLPVFAATIGVLSQSFFIDSTHWRHLWLILAMGWAFTIIAGRAMQPRASPLHGRDAGWMLSRMPT
jgi:O-antigen ligase